MSVLDNANMFFNILNISNKVYILYSIKFTSELYPGCFSLIRAPKYSARHGGAHLYLNICEVEAGGSKLKCQTELHSSRPVCDSKTQTQTKIEVYTCLNASIFHNCRKVGGTEDHHGKPNKPSSES
jgi:hypothetical protein